MYLYLCRRPTGKEGEFFIQLFLESDTNVLPNTESLLHKMFIEQKIVFDKVRIIIAAMYILQ